MTSSGSRCRIWGRSYGRFGATSVWVDALCVTFSSPAPPGPHPFAWTGLVTCRGAIPVPTGAVRACENHTVSTGPGQVLNLETLTYVQSDWKTPYTPREVSTILTVRRRIERSSQSDQFPM